MTGVYKITSPNNKTYVGSSIDIERRFKRYKRLSCKAQLRLYNSFIKYGVENHKFEVLFECNIEQLFEHERKFGEYYNSLGNNGLNCRLPKTDDIQKSFSEDALKRMSLAHKGQIPTNLEQLRQINIGKICSETTRKRISIANKGRGCANHLIGIPRKNETKFKISEAKKKWIVNSLTGARYLGAEVVASMLNISAKYLRSMLTGNIKNNTVYIYE